jgi:hypothetical protein
MATLANLSSSNRLFAKLFLTVTPQRCNSHSLRWLFAQRSPFRQECSRLTAAATPLTAPSLGLAKISKGVYVSR